MTSPTQTELILNVDDTDAARYAKSRILSRAGYRVIEAANGEEALQLAHTEAPDLVLLDTKLPDINGFEVCRRLKSDPQTRMVLVLQTSASYVATPDKVRALDSGADNYLFEPIEPDELVANVRALLRLGRVERELRDVDRRKDEFLAILAHELRNPLGPIRHAAELLRQLDPDARPELDNARLMILRQTEHMVRLVEDLLDVSRISQGKIVLRREDVNLADVLRAAMETSELPVRQRQHALDLQLPADELWVNADSVRLAQMVGNLLNNAAKFTPPGGQLSLAASREGGEAVIRVSDNGIGMTPGQMTAIFDLFTQAGHSADRVQDGLGIGLALVKTLVTLHGGSVVAHSDGLDQGSTFTLRLPAVAPAPAAVPAENAPPAAAPAEAPAVSTGRRLLVVDDNVDSVEMLAALLGYAGHEVHTAGNGADAIALARSLVPDLIFLDIGLPDMSGFEAAAILRQDPAMRNTVLVALSGYGQDKDRNEAIAKGFDQHLTKPVTFETLRQTIADLTGS